MTADSVEAWYAVPPDAAGFPSSQPWEQLYATPVGESRYQISNVPFFARGVAYGDIVSARTTDSGWLEVTAVLQRSGHSVFRVWVADESEGLISELIAQLKTLGCQVERTLGQLLAIDVPADVEEATWSFLEAGKARGEWEVQVGYSPD